VRAIHSWFVAGITAAALLPAASAGAQTASYSDVPDQFRLEVGGFRLGSSTDLTFNKSGGSNPPVDFESLNVPENSTRGYIEGYWRPWRRHQFSLSWYRVNRDGDPTTTSRDINWGDRVITVGTTVTGHVDSSYLSGVYRFAAYKNDRFEIGPSLGFGRLSLTAGISGTATASGGAGSASGPFDVSRTLHTPTGDLGGYFYWWAIPRLLIRGDGRYIIIKPEKSEASVTDVRASALYHVSRHVGFGLQYVYTKFRYDRDILSTKLGGSLRYSGGQLVLASAF